MARTEVLEREITRIPKRCGSDFHLEYGKTVPDQALFDDIVSYLGEYRFCLPQYSYDYTFSQGKLRDSNRHDSMEEVSQRAIDLNRKKGRSSFREQAEKKAFQKLDHLLSSATTGDTIIWLSPPGPKEEGYGDYGFFFMGKVGEDSGSEKKIKMTAIRLEHSTIEQINKTVALLTSKKIDYRIAEDCLSDPHVLSEDISEGYVFSILRMVFSFEPNAEDQKKFKLIIQKMFPLITDFIQSVKNPWKAKAEKIEEFYSLENYALKLKRDYEKPVRQERVVVDFRQAFRLADIKSYGYEPPKVAGSCPTKEDKNGLASNNPLNKGSSLNSLFEDQEWFICPKCNYEADGPIGNKCPGCGITKEEFAKSGKEVCV